jgi:tetratricopeptide (TPR) repeat protein
MELSEESGFSLQPTIEQHPFQDVSLQSFFAEWCRINDSITPQYIDRQQWEEKRMKGILEDQTKGKKILFLPQDLHLWEMGEVIESIDADTYLKKPEQQQLHKEELIKLGKTFCDMGIYISKRIDSIKKGRSLAEKLAEEFFGYGESIKAGKKSEKQVPIEEMGKLPLSEAETDAIDHLITGDKLYASRFAKHKSLDSDQNIIEDQRRETLAQLFRVAQKTLNLQNDPQHGEKSPKFKERQPWESTTPFHTTVLHKTEAHINALIEEPKQKLKLAIFRRGLEKLASEMKFTNWKIAVNNLFIELNIDLSLEEKKIKTALGIPQLKKNLEDMHRTGNIEKLSKREIEIASLIQKAISTFPRKDSANNPSQMVVDSYINCVGASMLGGQLLSEVGLHYLVGDLPGHSILFLITSDNKVIWMDMLNPHLNQELTNEMIEGKKDNGAPLETLDIVRFINNENLKRLRFNMVTNSSKDKFWWLKNEEEKYVNIFKPEVGQFIQTLHNTGSELIMLGKNEDAIKVLNQVIQIDPKYSFSYNGLGNALLKLGKYDDAISAYRKAINNDPNYAFPYKGLGVALSEINKTDEAIRALHQAIKINPNYVQAYSYLGNIFKNLKRYDEAIESYNKAILYDSQSVGSYNNLGIIFYETKRYPEAIEMYQHALSIDPEEIGAFFNLGQAFSATGKAKEAIEMYSKFLELAEKNNQYTEIIENVKQKIFILVAIQLFSSSVPPPVH